MEIVLPGDHKRRRGQVHLVEDQHQGQPQLPSHELVQCWREVHDLAWVRSAQSKGSSARLIHLSPLPAQLRWQQVLGSPRETSPTDTDEQADDKTRVSKTCVGPRGPTVRESKPKIREQK